METKNELVKINASDYGLEESKAKEIETLFLPMLAKMSELEVHYNDILKLPIEPETCQMAKDLRLSYVKTRTGTAEIHQKLKAFYLSGGRFVDAFKNTQAFASGEKEETLKNIENHYEILEAQKKAALLEKRTKLISPYMEEVNTFSLGEMSEEVWLRFFAGAKLEYEIRIAAEKKAEEDRLAEIEAERIRQENIRLENEKLKKEAEEKEEALAAEREKVRKDNEEKERLAEIERKNNAAILKAQQEKADKERAELLAKVESERIKRENIEAEIRRKKAAELEVIETEKKARLAEEKKNKLAPDKDKLLAFGQAINDLPRPEIKSIEAAAVMSQINGLLVKLNNYIITEANKL